MDQDHYENHIESWASSLIALEEGYFDPASHSLNEQPTAPLIPLGTPTYYRSKAFASTIGINPLINAADPLLTLATKLRKITIPPDCAQLHQNICHELRAFDNKAQTMGYRTQLILAARFIICSLLDELIPMTLWPEMDWKKFSLVDTFHKEDWDNDRFFLILERSLQDAAGHLDLLELIYVCLRLGYEGKYRQLERGHYKLQNLTEHLFSVINHHRDEFSRGLHITLENPNFTQITKKNYLHLLPPAWMVSTLMILLLLSVFTFFYMKLVETASPVTQFLNTLRPVQEFTDPKIVIPH